MADIAADERVFCKLSGLATEAAEDWSPDTLGPYIDHVTRVFGPDRLLFGSDWPVMRMATDYAAWRAIFGDRLGADVDRILKQTPLRAYPRLIGRVPPPGPLR